MLNEVFEYKKISENDLANLLAVTQLSADKVFDYTDESRKLTVWKVNSGKLEVLRVYENFLSEQEQSEVDSDTESGVMKKIVKRMFFGGETEIYETIKIFDSELNKNIWYKVRGAAIKDSVGKITKTIGTFKNADDEKTAEIKLMDKAERDPLTKIYNKETTTSLIKSYIESDGYNNLSAMIIIDVDNFKDINDNLGHLFGDSVLVDLSQDLHDLFRTSDVVGRIGGDEFLVYMRGIKNKKHISEKAAEICSVFDSLYSGEDDVKITGSLGISVFPQDGKVFEDLFKKSDIALYHSKKLGKNCFTFYENCEHDISDEDFKLHVNRYHKDIPITRAGNLFVSEITDFAFDIMDKTHDVSSAIILLLSKVGKQFELSRVSVAETIEELYCLKYTYQWCAKGITPITDEAVVSSKEQWESKMQQYDDNDICSLVNIDKLCEEIDSNELNMYKKLGVKSFLDCAVYDSGDYKGFVSFSDCKTNRIWTIEEVRTLKTISKIVSSYLLKMRAFEKANLLVDKLTNYDKLTGLPKFNLFSQIMKDTFKQSAENDVYALIYFDFNSFKVINEKLGAENADDVLISFAEATKTICKGYISTCRIFSDKFICFIKVAENEDIKDKATKYIKRFTNKLKTLYVVDFQLSICAGIYMIDDLDECDVNVAIDNANIARKQAKLTQEDNCEYYSENMKAEMMVGIEIAGEVEQAIIDREFIVYYQPKISLRTGEVVGAEALIRWRKPDGTMIYPNVFIPHLEKTMHIVNVDFFVYEEACVYIRHCLNNNKKIVPISVNVSRMHLRCKDFLERVITLIEKYAIPCEYIEFELTESALLDDQEMAIKIMKNMRKLGFRVSIDDFGSGYSSLNLLKNLPVDILKLDKEFFGNGILKKNDAIVVSSIIDMANKMHIDVVCEGVETEQQVDFLKGTECTSVQGYYYARPVPLDEFEEYCNKMMKKK